MSEQTVNVGAEGNSANEAFFDRFKNSQISLQQRIDHLIDTTLSDSERTSLVAECLSEISRLSNEVQAVSSHLPAHDQRTYSTAVKGMTEKLQAARSLSAPRRKFAFKKSETQKNSSREHTANPAAQAPKTPSGSYDARSELSKNSSEVSEPGFRADSAGSPSVFDLFSLSSQCYILPESALKPAASIRNVDHSFIDLSISAKLARPFSTLAIKGASKSLLIGTRVSGAAHITGVENSTLVVWSRQVRMHDCKDCVLYLRCSSRPIIEDCSGMKFAPLPDFIHASSETPCAAISQNFWDQIDDFKWLKAEHSPNWGVLQPEDERAIESEGWAKIQNAEELHLELHELLRVGKIIQ